MSVQILSPEVVGQIAAGEVLDRPANLVKELVENALDAGATEIEVEYADTGRQVVVRDNGVGMSESDLKLATVRHATSKIRASEDIYRLHTFGFRGEALASAAAVSHMTITTRQNGQSSALRLKTTELKNLLVTKNQPELLLFRAGS